MGWLEDLKNKLRNHRFDGYAAIDRMPIDKRISCYEPVITKTFTAQRLDPIWGMAIAMQESSFRTTALAISGGDENVGGSYGLMMVSAKTSKKLGFKGDPIDLCMPEVGVLWASKIILSDMKDYGVSAFRDVAAIYNSGRRYLDAPQSTRNVYVPNVLKYASDFRVRSIVRR